MAEFGLQGGFAFLPGLHCLPILIPGSPPVILEGSRRCGGFQPQLDVWFPP